MFSDHFGIKLQIKNRMTIRKYLNTQKLNNTIENNPCIRETRVQLEHEESKRKQGSM